MLRTIAFLVNRQRSPHQQLGLLQPVRVLQQKCEVVAVYGNIGMLRPVAFLINRQRSPHQRVGLLSKISLDRRPDRRNFASSISAEVATKPLLLTPRDPRPAWVVERRICQAHGGGAFLSTLGSLLESIVASGISM